MQRQENYVYYFILPGLEFFLLLQGVAPLQAKQIKARRASECQLLVNIALLRAPPLRLSKSQCQMRYEAGFT